MSRRARTLGDVIPLAACEPDGLLVTSTGAYVRLLDCPGPLQPLRGGREHRDAIRGQLAALASRVAPGHGLQVVIEADELDVDSELARDWQQINTAAERTQRHGYRERGEAMRRFGYGLEQTLRRSAPLVQAQQLVWTIATRALPTPADWRAYLPALHRGVRTLSRGAHERAAFDSLRLSDTIARELTGAGATVRALDGPTALERLARIVEPQRQHAADAFAALPEVLDTTDAAAAVAHRHALVSAVSGTSGLQVGRDWLTHEPSGELEAVMHLSGAPGDTSLWWLVALMEVPPPWRLSVHLTTGDRARQRRRHRIRHKQLWADLQRRSRDGKLISPEAFERESEAAELDAELRLAGASGVYDLAVYFAIRRPAGREEELKELLPRLARDFEAHTDARLYSGRFLVEDSWVSSLPLGVDRLRATRRVAHRNIGDCLPLLSGSVSSSGGVPFGYATSGHTLERLDFFEPRFRTHVCLFTGASGSGKTVSVNALLARNLARGATGWIIDRSSSEDEGGSTRHAGHYEQLAALVPGAKVIHFGAGQHDAVLNPWDVRDPAHVPASKAEFLIALHTLLIGDHAGSDRRVLAGLEQTLLSRGISAVYARCAQSGERPRELLLYEELRRLAREQAGDADDGDATVASEYRRLAERLHPYIGPGPAAWLADHPTTVPADAPLILFDLAGLADSLAGPVMLTLVDFIDRQVQRRRAEHLTHPHRAAGPWAGHAFVAIDEAWKPLLTPAAGAWLNEWARRTRHLACALLVITQHLSDFANAQGEALLRNSVLRVFFRTAFDELTYVRDALGLHPEDLDAIAGLETRKGEYSTCLVDSEIHGRGQLQVLLGDMEYWTCSADPERDQPIRQLALQEADGDPWEALRRLVDPNWHLSRAEALTAPDAVNAEHELAHERTPPPGVR